MKRFEFKAAKAFQAIRWILNGERKGSANIRRLCTAFFLADHEVLNIRGRPIFGDLYFAMEHGPVPDGIYKMIEGWPGEIVVDYLKTRGVIRGGSLPWKKRGTDIVLAESIEGDPDPDVHCTSIAPEELRIITEQWSKGPVGDIDESSWYFLKGWSAWRAARERPGHRIAYEDMLEGDDWDI